MEAKYLRSIDSDRKPLMRLSISKFFLFFMTTICLNGCGGGSSSSPSAISPIQQEEAKTDFESGTFQPFEQFSQICESPREGTDAQGNPFRDSQGSSTDENNWLRSWSHELYLWYDEIADVDPESLPTAEYFDQMKTFEQTESGTPKDKFHFSIPTDEWVALSQGGVVAGYGAEFKIISSSPPRRVVVAYTEPNSPATSDPVNLIRGAEILEIDGVDVENSNDIDTLNNGLFPQLGETHSFLVRNNAESPPRSITMTAEEITSTPVQNLSFLQTESGLVGYFTFNNHIAPAEELLIEAIKEIRDRNIADLVVDLRYNGGGFLAIANELSSMIAGDDAVGQIFEELEFNNKHPEFNPITGERLSPKEFLTVTQGFSVPEGTPLPTLGLERVFIISGSGTCSASESIINGLRGIDVEVILVGDTTCGKPYGFYAFDNCGTTYFSIQFRGKNNKGFGDYSDGFSPDNLSPQVGLPIEGCAVPDDFDHKLGDPDEARLKAVLDFRQSKTCPETTDQTRASIMAEFLTNAPSETSHKKRLVWRQNRIIQ